MEVTAATASSEVMAKVFKETTGAQIITQTLDKINAPTHGKSKSCASSGMSETYNFSKDVLSAVYGGKGSIANSEG